MFPFYAFILWVCWHSAFCSPACFVWVTMSVYSMYSFYRRKRHSSSCAKSTAKEIKRTKLGELVSSGKAGVALRSLGGAANAALPANFSEVVTGPRHYAS